MNPIAVSPASPIPGSNASAPRIRSDMLFRTGIKEVLIEHRGECYRLRLTRQDKLILNK